MEIHSSTQHESESLPRWKSIVIAVWSLGVVGFALWFFFACDFPRTVWLAYATWQQIHVTSFIFQSLALHLYHLLCAVLLLGNAAIVGQLCLRLLRQSSEPSLREFLMSLVVGVLVIGDSILLIGSFGILQPLVFWLIALVPLAIYVVKVAQTSGLRFWKKAGERIALLFGDLKPGDFEFAILLLVILSAIVNWVGACTPPHEFDSLVYQMAAPKEYMQRGRIEFLPHNFYSSQPALVNMLYLWGMVVGSGGDIDRLLAGGDGVPHMLNWCAGLLTALAVYSLAKDRLSPHAALLAASAFYLCPWLFHFSSCARVDIWVCFFATVALLEGWRATDDGDRRSWIRCGLAVGAAMSTKFSGAAIVGLPLAIALLVHPRVPTIARLGNVFIFLGIAVLAFSPWLIKSGLWTANPVYPFLQHFFHSPFWDAARDKFFFAEHSPSFSWWDERGFRYQLEHVPSAVAVFAWPIPLLVLWPKFWKRFSFAIMWAGLAIGIWLVTMIPVWRYAFPVFAVFPLLAALIFRECESASLNRWLVRTSFLVFALWALFGQTIRKSTENIANHDDYPPKSNSWTFLFNSATGPPLVEQMFPSINWMNQNLPLSSRVLFVTDEKIYYARHLPDYSTSFGECWLSKLAKNCKDADEFYEGVRRRGITHIYLSVGFALREERNGYMRGFDWDLFHQFLNRHTRPIQPQFDNKIYEILPVATQKDSLTNP